MKLFSKIKKRVFLFLINNFKTNETLFVNYDNFLNLAKNLEKLTSKCEFFDNEKITFNNRRYQLMASLIGTPPTEAYFIIEAIHQTLNIEGEYCEFGVAQGTTSALIANEILDFPNKKLNLFDSFEGLPEPTKEDKLINDIFNYGEMSKYRGAMSSPKDSVLNKLNSLKIPESKYKIFEGFVDDNFHLKKDLPKKVCFAYLDFDFYKPIKIVLNFLQKNLSKGGFVIIDDYNYFSSGVKLAVDEFLEDKNEQFDSFIAPIDFGHFIVLKKKK